MDTANITLFEQAVSKRAGRKKDPQPSGGGGRGGQGPIKRANYDIVKKKEVGVSDLTLISKISNEAINDNLKKRFENGEIYVGSWSSVCWKAGNANV